MINRHIRTRLERIRHFRKLAYVLAAICSLAASLNGVAYGISLIERRSNIIAIFSIGLCLAGTILAGYMLDETGDQDIDEETPNGVTRRREKPATKTRQPATTMRTVVTGHSPDEPSSSIQEAIERARATAEKSLAERETSLEKTMVGGISASTPPPPKSPR